MSVKKSETALAERIGRKKLRGIKYLLLAVPFLIYVFAFSYVPLVVTTNLTLSELNNASDIAHKRIYDRILER